MDEMNKYFDELDKELSRELPIEDLWFAKYFVDDHKKAFAYCKEYGWMFWTGKYWREGEEYELIPLIEATVKKLLLSEDEKVRKWAFKANKASAIKNCISLTKSYCLTDFNKFNQNPMLFNCSNGILDLSKEKLHKHDPNFYQTTIADVEYNPTAKCPEWLSFMDKIFLGDKELIRYVQNLIGYCLTGLTGQQEFYILYGTGQNGKSMFINTIEKLLCDYAQKARVDLVVSNKYKKDDALELSDLNNVRFLYCSEPDQDVTLKESEIKNITGGDKIKGRKLYKKFFSYTPSFKVFLITNHKPEIKGTDHGLWRRIKMIPFNYRIKDEEKIAHYDQKNLFPELSGILNWALQGFFSVDLKKGFEAPEIVLNATQEYREEEDTFNQFLEDHCIIADYATVTPTKILNKYREVTGDNSCSHKKLAKMLKERGFKNSRTMDQRFWKGLDLKQKSEDSFYD